jgi:hypothetical protein
VNFLAGLGIFVIAFPILLILSILSLMWRAWWLYPLWAWFIVPLGARPITFWHFTALIFIVNIITTKNDFKKDDRPTDWSGMVIAFFWPIMLWAILQWMHS